MSITLTASPTRAGKFALALTEAMWLAILLALPLVMNVSVARSFEASKLMAVAPMAALCLAALLAAALERVLAPARPLLRAAPALAFIALIASAVVATLASETPWVAFFGDYFRREGLLSWLVYATLFAAMLLTLRRREQVERLIDVLMVASVVPCVYAIMQRYGYDFFQTQGLLVGTSAARPGGTMGNPTFLASLLLLVIPVSIARTLAVGGGWRGRAPWLLLLALQLFAAVLTQSRGPLIGVAVALFVLLLLLGARERARALVLGAVAAALVLGLGLALINLIAPLAQATAGTPLQRFVFTSGDLTVSARVGIWQAGVDSFTHAPWWRQWIGYGPDAASFNYFNWMPAGVQRTEGYSETIDRLHSEYLETLLSFGILGLAAQVALFSTLVWSAAQRLLPRRAHDGAVGGGKSAWAGYALFVVAMMIAGALLALGISQNRGILPIGAGSGLATAWVLFLAWRAWRYTSGPAQPTQTDLTRADALLIAALISALIGSWVETQVGVPTIATRALVASFAALSILAVNAAWREGAAPAAVQPAAPAPAPAVPAPAAAAGRKARKKRAGLARQASDALAAALPETWYPVLGWAVCLALIISVADFFPPLSGTRMLAPSMQRLPLIIWPLAAMLLTALVIARVEARRHPCDKLQAVTRFLLWSVPAPLAFILVYAKLGFAIENTPDAQLGERISALIEFSFAAYLCVAVLLGCALFYGDRRGPAAARRSGAAGLAALAAGAALSVATFLAMRADFSADVRAKLGGWAQGQGKTDAATAFLGEAITLMPRERRFAGTYAARLVESASSDATLVAKQPEAAEPIAAKLGEAERVLAIAHERAPRDPWITFAYANVQQFLGMKVLSAIQTPEKQREHVELARKYLALAHAQFPGHPWILRNWAQLEFDQGNRPLAYTKLDEMEKLDPLNLSAYTERIKLARLDNNPGLAIAAARRGLTVLPRQSYEAAVLLQDLINIPRSAGQYGQAISGALEYTATQPERIGAWRQLAELYEINNQRDLALSIAQGSLSRFAGASLDTAGKTDYAALQAQVRRLTYGAAGSGARPNAGAPAAAAPASPPPAGPPVAPGAK